MEQEYTLQREQAECGCVQRLLGNTPIPSTCKTWRPVFDMCPTHTAAPALLGALERIAERAALVVTNGRLTKQDAVDGLFATRTQARDAIALTKGG